MRRSRSAKGADMQKITPFLWFDKEAEEAANFYVSVFANSKIVSVSRYGAAGPGENGSVMSVTFSSKASRSMPSMAARTTPSRRRSRCS